MMWIDGEYFEPIFFDCLHTRAMMLQFDIDKLKAIIFDELSPIMKIVANSIFNGVYGDERD